MVVLAYLHQRSSCRACFRLLCNNLIQTRCKTRVRTFDPWLTRPVALCRLQGWSQRCNEDPGRPRRVCRCTRNNAGYYLHLEIILKVEIEGHIPPSALVTGNLRYVSLVCVFPRLRSGCEVCPFMRVMDVRFRAQAIDGGATRTGHHLNVS
ncbi:hypothetical protein K437DRAFT_161423 [Tilletiaria anomala UBC 951]|uniref:Uncharacterized protein n=1 Tax=Tilletiaria anomala (strain ATCC 24038 / CBS 436.72 / UBC 951) TaxID=1037660 RepID=A0A066WFC2_TILAU|nr:uncharacterized protein K437DRAFT_161423 [Tilletiaria anomala UBC 951]KDN52677.1 hypothetical protein K437DRAFT_161423 [Tilletiaria anomala UBC 951]